MIARAVLVLLGLVLAWPIHADTLRIATWNIEMSRDGPGLLLRDLDRAEDPRIAAAVAVLAQVKPDVLAVQGFDHDHGLMALYAFAGVLSAAGIDYPHRLALATNRGLATDLDLNGDGRRGDPQDAQGFGTFYGRGALAMLSRLPLDAAGVQDFTAMLWRDLPGAQMPLRPGGGPFPSEQAAALQRLSSSGHWVVPVLLPDGTRLHVTNFHAAPPVFDGPEDQNGLRNRDEIRFWQVYLDGAFGPVPDALVIAGSATLDPGGQDGRTEAIAALLADPRLQDPRPAENGDPATVDWPPPGPGRLRVDYLLPTRALRVLNSGLAWPVGPDRPSRHALVWVDLAMPLR